MLQKLTDLWPRLLRGEREALDEAGQPLLGSEEDEDEGPIDTRVDDE